MKYFVRIAKIFLYCIVGGMLGFLIMFLGTYTKANSIAGNIAQSGLLLATQNGCINHDDIGRFCTNMHKAYGWDPSDTEIKNSKSILVNPTYKGDPGSGWDTSWATVEPDSPTGVHQYIVDEDTAVYHCGLISVKDIDNNSLINTSGQDYFKHVQRGSSITVHATVEANMYFNWVFGANNGWVSTHGGEHGDGRNELRFSFPVNASATGISCKWFKGES